jgi:transcriptional regulator with XRE-family HTH domain
MDNNKISAKIKAMRDQLGWSQVELSRRMSLTQPTISDWESGKKLPTVANLIRLAELFGMPFSALVDSSSQADWLSMMSQLRSTRSDSSAALYVQSPSDTYQAGLEVATPNPVLTDEEMRLLRLC